MKINKICLFVLGVLAFSSCVKTQIKGTLEGVDTLIVKSWEGTYLKTLDTLTLKDGYFSYNLKVEKGDPRFVYIYNGEGMLTPLFVEQGSKISVNGDKYGQLSIEGSEASQELQRLSLESISVLSSLMALSNELEGEVSKAKRTEITREFNRIYLDHYRSRIKYVVDNPYSLNNIIVLNETLGSLALFSRAEDAIYFKAAADSLEIRYPQSLYVKVLKKDAQDRMSALTLNQQIQGAGTVDYPEISLPGLDGKKISLTETVAGSKMTIIYFWSSAAAANNVFNSDYMKNIYARYHRKGLEVYAISVDTDKSAWARACRDQNLVWKNVCDGFGIYSNVIPLYNVTQIPTLYFIHKGSILEANVTKPEEIEPFIKKYL